MQLQRPVGTFVCAFLLVAGSILSGSDGADLQHCGEESLAAVEVGD